MNNSSYLVSIIICDGSDVICKVYRFFFLIIKFFLKVFQVVNGFERGMIFLNIIVFGKVLSIVESIFFCRYDMLEGLGLVFLFKYYFNKGDFVVVLSYKFCFYELRYNGQLSLESYRCRFVRVIFFGRVLYEVSSYYCNGVQYRDKDIRGVLYQKFMGN